MTSTRAGRIAAALLVAAAIEGCAAANAPAQTGAPPARAPAAGTAADSSRHSVNPADVRFITDMIAHHSQAVLIAGWAPSHGASPELQALTSRIVVGQRDDITTMDNWLRDNGQPVPSSDTLHQRMAGMAHMLNMPGMLTPEQLTQLDQARGPEFDHLFLTFMIKHHQGAITMVNQLFDSQGAAQDETVFRLASNIQADQTAEIERMQKLLGAMLLKSWQAQ